MRYWDEKLILKNDCSISNRLRHVTFMSGSGLRPSNTTIKILMQLMCINACDASVSRSDGLAGTGRSVKENRTGISMANGRDHGI